MFNIGYKIGLNELSPVLEEIAFLRLENPEASLQELAEMIGISKSGIRNSDCRRDYPERIDLCLNECDEVVECDLIVV